MSTMIYEYKYNINENETGSLGMDLLIRAVRDYRPSRWQEDGAKRQKLQKTQQRKVSIYSVVESAEAKVLRRSSSRLM